MNYWLECWKKYAVFSGRARRKEYWMFLLFNVLIVFGVSFLLGFVAGEGGVKAAEVFGCAYQLAGLLPGLGVAVRRLHDTGRSGWMLLICLIPFVGAIALFVFMCLDSQPGPNEYGPNPKAA